MALPIRPLYAFTKQGVCFGGLHHVLVTRELAGSVGDGLARVGSKPRTDSPYSVRNGALPSKTDPLKGPLIHQASSCILLGSYQLGERVEYNLLDGSVGRWHGTGLGDWSSIGM